LRGFSEASTNTENNSLPATAIQ